jgi:MFS family permease
MQIGLLLFGATSIWAAFAGTAEGLIAARAAMGVGAALVFPATLAILSNVFTDPTERAKAIGIWSATTGLAVALGPVTGGWLLEHFWWGSVFLVNIPIILVALPLGAWLLPSSKDPDAGRLDPIGLVSSIAAIALLVFTVIEAPHKGWTSVETIAGFVAFAVLFATFIWWERRRRDPMLDVTVFRNPRFSAASFSVAVAFFGLFGFIFLITQYFQFCTRCRSRSAPASPLRSPPAWRCGSARPGSSAPDWCRCRSASPGPRRWPPTPRTGRSSCPRCCSSPRGSR